MLDTALLARLKTSRNLLAFSGGADSTALFHLLLEHHIAFDIVHVNYHTRVHSDDEAKHAITLAQKYEKKIYIYDAPAITSNFEATARELRYRFFHECIEQYRYETLLTAHQLGDRLEWFLMQLSKGAGVYELMGMKSIEDKAHYSLIRPLLHVNKSELITYLETREISWFEDESNHDERYTRNYFRHHFSDPLLEKFSQGILKSFTYLEQDARIPDVEITHINELSYFKTHSNPRHNLVSIDKILKERGFIMRQGDKELLKSVTSHVVGRKYAIGILPTYTFIAPYSREIMSKPFKETCRKLGVPEKIRPYLFTDSASFESVVRLLSAE